jgi:hypothetical protein
MEMKPGNWCPLIRKNCVEHKCSWFVQVRGLNPNTGAEIDEWSCAVSWMPLMAIEIAQKENQTGAAVESFRNEVVRCNNENKQLYLDSIDRNVIPAIITPLNSPNNFLPSNDEDTLGKQIE